MIFMWYKLKYIFYSIFFIFLILNNAGCGEEDCLSNYTSLVTIQFINLDDEMPNPIYNRVYALGFNETLLFNQELPAHTFILPVNPGADAISYVFSNETIQDTLTITYSRRARVLSSNCDLEHRFLNVNIHPDPNLTTFDSLIVEKNVLSIPSTEINVKIFN
ncbi:hypothetical protein BH23BAC1_BH23BAC1_34590 [soil metagenome]